MYVCGCSIAPTEPLSLLYCLTLCLSLLRSVDLCVCVSLAFPVADFNSPGTVERWRVAVWIAGTKDGAPGTSNIPTT